MKIKFLKIDLQCILVSCPFKLCAGLQKYCETIPLTYVTLLVAEFSYSSGERRMYNNFLVKLGHNCYGLKHDIQNDKFEMKLLFENSDSDRAAAALPY